jgi:hypothetical protein
MEGQTPASELVREGWDSLPGEEQAVDYPKTGQVGQLAPLQYATLTPTKDLSIEVIVRTPDGLRLTFEEAVEYELEEDGAPKDFSVDDAQDLWSALKRTVDARLSL